MRQLKIAVADDEPAVRAVLAAWLTNLGHVVMVAADGVELVALCRCGCYDLVVSDVQMPELDGIDAAAIIRRECGTQVILLSGDWTVERTARARGVGVFRLGKPVSSVALVAMLEEASRRKDLAMA